MSGLISYLRLEARLEKARMYFREFAEQTVLASLPHRVPAAHQELLCQVLQRLADTPGDAILLVCLPPGGAKSMFCSRALPAWLLGRSADVRILSLTNTAPLAETNGRAVRDIVTSRVYQRIFEDATLLPQSSSATSFSVNNPDGRPKTYFGAGMFAATLGQRATWLIVDDPISGFEEASSEEQLEKLWRAYQTQAKTRAERDMKTIVVCQRLARNDLVGRILRHHEENPETTKPILLRLPMIADSEDDPLGRAIGDPLWPQYWTPGRIADAQSDRRIWRTMYQQEPPSDDGDWCSPTDINVVPAPVVTSAYRVYIGIDVATTEARGDYTAIVIVAFEKITGRMHIVDIYHEQVDHAAGCEALLDKIDRWSPEWVGIEGDTGSKGFVSHLRTRALARGVGIGMLQVEGAPRGSKELRASALRAKIKRGLLCLDDKGPLYDTIRKELLVFPNAGAAGHDDIVDALAIVARKTSAMVIEKPVDTTPKPLPTVQHDMCLEHLFEDNEIGLNNSYRRI